MLVQVILIFVFIGLNGIFAASEIALVSANRKKVEADVESGKKIAKKAKKVLKLSENPTRFLSTIQIGITMFGFINGAIAANAFADQLANTLSQDFNWDYSVASPIITVVITLLLTYLQVVLGELVPKRLAMKAPEKVAYFFVGFLSGIALIMRPFVILLTGTANLIVRMFGINPNENDDTMTEDELRLELNASEQKGVIDRSENEMIQNIFEFDTTTVEEVMTHRTEVSAIDIEATRDEVIKYVTSEKYTRFPVYEGTIDKIIGTLHVKDLLKFLDENPDTNVFDLKSLLRDPFFVPQSKNTRQLFKDMQASKVHIAIVIDEYGGTAGIVTFEDLIEEIVGNIFDEYDDEEIEISTIQEDQYEIDGLTNIDDVEEIINAKLPVEEYDTLSGFILGQLGRFPDQDETIVIVYNNYRFEVLSIDDKVIGRVKVTKIDDITNDNDEADEG
ncbi:HlyC/CorC family transporter [Acholeplasma equirhinis]|uniref:hemolysin family protein n=1 Tax=Acholeplasma equirhinis TaxID=555393 RepID=UPI00197AE03C|nr:hemolysin family protein [Acholeplasma equirhinis]MBN3490357.1 HlyC/CorC family transporter [Acholeplasma equirhinis]